MKYSYFGALHVCYYDNEYTQNIVVYSYNTMIAFATIHKDKGLQRFDTFNFDSNFYSVSTRKHQGIAYSILKAFEKYGYDFIVMAVNHSKSQKQLIKHFGYTPLQQQYNCKINTLWSEHK